MRCWAVDLENCVHCGGRMKLRKLIMRPDSIQRLLRFLGEPTEPPPRAPARDPPSSRAACCAAFRIPRRSSRCSGSSPRARAPHARGCPHHRGLRVSSLATLITSNLPLSYRQTFRAALLQPACGCSLPAHASMPAAPCPINTSRRRRRAACFSYAHHRGARRSQPSQRFYACDGPRSLVYWDDGRGFAWSEELEGGSIAAFAICWRCLSWPPQVLARSWCRAA
jgi:hypothetical protein